MYFPGGVTLEFLLIKGRDEIMSTEILAQQAELYIPAREK